MPSIITNNIAELYSELVIGKKRIKLYKSKVEITSQNYKLVQMLELLESIEKGYEKELDKVQSSIFEYLKAEKFNEDYFSNYINKYPEKIQKLIQKLEMNKVLF